jgi:hypothetical protein
MATTLISLKGDGLVERVITTKRAAVAGMIGPIMFSLLVVSLTLIQYDFMLGLGWHPLQASDVPWPSALALGPYGWLQVVNFVLFGLLLIAFAVGLDREIVAGKWAKLGPTLLSVAGIALVFCGFKTDPHLASGPQTIAGWMHTLGFFLLLGSLLPTFFVIGRRLRKDARWRGYDGYSLVTGVLALGTVFLSQVGFYLSLFLILAWIEVIAMRLWALSGQSLE